MLRQFCRYLTRTSGARTSPTLLLLAAGAAVTSIALVAAGPAAAKSVRAAMNLTCSSGYGDTAITADVESNAPDSVPVGQSISPIPINAVATAPSYVTDALNFVGARSITGTASATAIVESADGERSVTVRLPLQQTAVPASGPLTIDAGGETPAWVFHQPGTVQVVFSGLDLSITPMNAGGQPTIAGTVDASCGLDSGDSRLDEFQVTPVAAPSSSPSQAPGNPGPSDVAATGATTTPSTSASSQPTAGSTVSAAPSQAVSGSVQAYVVPTGSQGADAIAATSVGATSNVASSGGMDNTGLLLIVVAASAAAFAASAAFVRFRKRGVRNHEPGSG